MVYLLFWACSSVATKIGAGRIIRGHREKMVIINVLSKDSLSPKHRKGKLLLTAGKFVPACQLADHVFLFYAQVEHGGIEQEIGPGIQAV